MMTELLEPILRERRLARVKGLIKPGSDVCDIGCGSGFHLLKSLYDDLKSGVGIDYLVESGAEGFPKLKLLKFRIDGKLPLRDSSFDFVTSLASMEHMDKPEAVLYECWRILRPFGTLILTTPSKRSKPVLEVLAALNLVSRKEISEHKHYFDAIELERMLASIGFKRIKVKTFELGMNLLATATK